MANRSKPTPNHKFGGVSIGAQTSCECGWRSAVWFGKGAQHNARTEWHIHIDNHKREQGNG